MKDEGSDIDERTWQLEKDREEAQMSAQSVTSMVKQRQKQSQFPHEWLDVLLLRGIAVKSQSITDGARPYKHAHSDAFLKCIRANQGAVNPSQGLYVKNKCPTH